MNSPLTGSSILIYPVENLRYLAQPQREGPDKIYCPYCGGEAYMLWLHGHYQCSCCKIVVSGCCESE